MRIPLSQWDKIDPGRPKRKSIGRSDGGKKFSPWTDSQTKMNKYREKRRRRAQLLKAARGF